MGLITKLTNIATAISNKTGQPASEYTLDNMPTAISAIQTSYPAPVVGDTYAVRFMDYDGTVISDMTYAQAAALTSLPELPSHTGLTAVGWTSTLQEVQSVTSPNQLVVGAMYSPSASSGDTTQLFLRMPSASTTVTLNFSQTVSDGVTIDWGDGSATETVTGTGIVNPTHTYAAYAKATLELTPATGCDMILGANNKNIFNTTSNSNYLMEARIGRTDLASRAFTDCSSLTSVVIPNSVTSINSNAFQSCLSLTSVVIPNSVTSINSNAFSSCYSLTSVVIPNSVTSISSNVFSSCSSLTSVVIPNSVTFIGSYVFSSCSSLTSVVISNSVTSISNYAFQNCYSLTSVVIPNSVTSIGTYAFYYCYSLTSVVISNSVTSISNYPFTSCYALDTISFDDRASMPTSAWLTTDCKIGTLDFTDFTTVPTLSSTSFFSNLPTYTKIVVPDSLYDTWIVATNWSNYASQIVKESEA